MSTLGTIEEVQFLLLFSRVRGRNVLVRGILNGERDSPAGSFAKPADAHAMPGRHEEGCSGSEQDITCWIFKSMNTQQDK